MAITYVNVTDIAHDDHQIEAQLLDEVNRSHFPSQDESDMTKTGRKLVLDADWITLPAVAQGTAHTLYKSEIEFILIKTDTNIRFRRIFPTNAEAELGNVDWGQPKQRAVLPFQN